MTLETFIDPVRSVDGECSEETCQEGQHEAWRLYVIKDGIYPHTLFFPPSPRGKKRALKAERLAKQGRPPRLLDQGMGKDWLPSRGLIRV